MGNRVSSHNMLEVIGQLKRFFEEAADVYACGICSCTMFQATSVSTFTRYFCCLWHRQTHPRELPRLEEGKGPDLVIELTSASTKREDL